MKWDILVSSLCFPKFNWYRYAAVNAAGFASVQAERFALPGFGLISSQVAGIAIAWDD
jgi:hypothetical protein